MASSVDICNLALSRVAQDQIISLSDDSQNARVCNSFYAQTLDEVLQSNPWRFAVRTQQLSRLSTNPVTVWAYQYQLPENCLRVLKLNESWSDQIEDYCEVQANKLLTNETVAIIKFIAREEDASLYPPLFIEALACKLAARIAKPLTGDDKKQEAFLTEYARLTGPEARRIDAYVGFKRVRSPYATSELIMSRYKNC